MPKFRPKGKPLTQTELDELGRIRVKDVDNAIAKASPQLREFLEAKSSE